MNAFLWSIFIVGVLEVGSFFAYYAVGVMPQRTLLGMAINAASWAFIAAWAAYLFVNK